MRVGFDARWYNDSGVGTYVAELLKALTSIPPGSGATTERQQLELVVYEDPANPVPGLENKVERIPLAAPKYSFRSQTALNRRCALDRLDVFHSPFYPIPLRMSCPVVVTIHDLIPFLFPINTWAKQFMVKSGYRIAARRCSRIIAVSQHTANDITRILRARPEKIAVVHNAVASEAFHPNGSSGESAHLADRYGIHPPYAVVGSTRNWRTKNLGSALRALALAQGYSGMSFQTVVCGSPDGFQAVGGPDAWKQLNLVQTGHLPAAELGRMFRHAHLSVMAPLYEGFGLAILEAMACGCAVITSNGGSLPEVVGAAAQKFDPFDVTGMARAATTLLSNPAELKVWQERAVQRAADFSWTKAARETV
ncbi:MAG TPA: glycosyltransferase family 1 protein, partial [Candidatus Angelobacter sp.]